MKRYIFTSIFFLLALVACQPDAKILPWVKFENPESFPAPTYDFKANPVTPAGFALGKKLFYDPILSRDSTISCGSCHQQAGAFTHIDHRVSHGINDLLGKRNAPAIQNMAWMKQFFWDGGVHLLDIQPLNPIKNPVEMDESLDHVVEKLKQHPEYPEMFRRAFGTDEISISRLGKAFSQFQGMLISADSRYDRFKKGKATFSAQEQNGYFLFQQKCASCHQEPLFTNQAFVNNGLPLTALPDSGQYGITRDPAHIYRFKVPSLRNIAVTEPYMHDGRFSSLQKVLDHYGSNIQATQNIEPTLVGGLSLSASEKTDIIAFLRTLTDSTFLQNPLFREE